MKRLAASLILLAGGALAAAGTASALEPRNAVVLRTLDKITGNARDVTTRVGQSVKFGPLNVTVRACHEAPPEDTPESAAFLEITTSAPPTRGLSGVSDQRGAAPPQGDMEVFSGWMFASSPGLNALEYPTYDVWVISCSAG